MKTIYYFSKRYALKIKNLLCVFALWMMCGQASAQISSKYTFSYVGTVAYASIAGTTLQSAAAGVGTDAVFSSIPINFSFNFNCQTYTTCGISNNGFIWFGTGTPAITNYTPLSSTTGQTGTIDGIIAVAGSNITGQGATAAVRYITSGTAPNRTFTVEWKSVLEGGVERCDHEIRLTETSNKIELIGFDNSYLVSGTANIQRGIRGAVVTDFMNRKTSGANNLCSTLAGTLNTDVCQIVATTACNYMTSASSQAINHTFSFTGSCCTPPTTTASAFSYSNVVVNGGASTADFNFTRGNGDGGVIAIAKAGSAPSAPANGTVYSGANTAYGSGTALGGGFLVYTAAGSGSGVVNVSLSALTNGTTYYIGIYEYNATANCYVSSALSGNIPIPVCSPPSTQASGNSVSNIQTNQADINWTGNGNGDDVIVFFKQGSAITTDPTQTTNYNANAGFGLGDQIGATGARAVYKGTGSTVTVTGLTTNITYYYAIYAHNSTTNCYSVPPITGSFTSTNSPMTTSAQVVSQVSVAAVTPGSVNNQILQIRIDCGTGTAPAFVLNQLFFTTAATNGGTTNPADIANAKVYSTGTSSTFATTTQFGSTVTSPNGAFVVGGSTTLVPGSNYFWLTYNITASPTIGDFVDAKCTTIDIGPIINPATGDPAGNRQITLTYCTPSPAFGGSSCSAAGNVYITTARLSGTTFYSGGTCGANPYTNLSGSVIANALTGVPYILNLTSADPTALYDEDYYAWVDFNNNGLFTDPGENILAVTLAPGASQNVFGSSFTPASAGSFRMRVAVMSGGFGSIPVISPCAGQSLYYGEFKDFTLNVQASSSPMVYASSTTTQNTAPLPPNNNNQQIVGLQVVTTGTLSPLSLTSLTFNTNGSTNITGDATNARVYYTGISGSFSTTTQFGSTVASPSGSHIVTGSQTLSPGTNYFWIAYDVPSTATLGNVLDAECTSIDVSSSTYTPSVTAPAGSRPISLVYCVPSAGATGCSFGGDDVITEVTLTGAGSTFNFTGGTCLVPYPNNYQINPYTGDVNQGGSYTVTMIKAGSSFGARFIAWVDWNNDADFTDGGEMIMDVTQTGASATGTSFTVPGIASAGAHRMRTWIGYTGTIVTSDIATVVTGCEVLNGASNQGEVRDFTVNVLSGCIAPVIGSCPSNIIQCDNHVATFSTPSATGTTPTVTCTPASGSTFATGTTSVTCTATNACGSSSCSFNVTINETPVISACPANISQCDVYIASWTDPTATGTPAASVSCSPASGSAFAAGTTSVTCTATNSCGSSSCSFNVTVNETPVISACPANISQCDVYTATWTDPTATGTPAASVSCTPASGSTFAAGTTTVTCTATNSCGSDQCTFTVTINETPVISACPANISQCDIYTASWTDPTATGTPAASVSCSPASGSAFAAGTTTVTCTATNSCGSDQCTFTVTINETPVISACPANISQCDIYTASWTDPTATGTPAASVSCSPASGSTFVAGTTTVTCTATNSCGSDQCTFTVTINETPVISACPANISQCDIYTASWTDPTATGTPAASVSCSPASGSTFAAGTTTVTCTATNSCGSDQCTFTVTINETPVIGSCPANITTCNPVVTFATPSSTGTPAATVTCSPASGSTFAPGNTTVNCTATNTCGSSSCSFTVNVQTPSAAATSATSNALYGQICIGGNLTLTANGGSLGTGASWVWYEGGCGTGASVGSGSPLTITPSLGNHNYFVRAEGACGNTACVSVAVSVISAPPSNTIGITSAPADGCVGAPAQTVSVNNVANCTFYNWSSSQTGVRFNGFPSPYQTSVPTVSVTYVSLPAAGSSGWSICVFGGNVCGNTNTVCAWVRATIGAPTSISGATIGCPGSSGNAYSSSTVAGAVSYQWSSTGGIVVAGNGAQAITVSFPAGFVTGTLSVRGQTSCGYMGPNRTITINANPAIPGAISGTSYPCPNASSTYSIAPVPGAVNYTWTTSVAGAVVTGNSTSCSILFPASIPGGSSVSVVANSSCPTSSAVRSKGIAGGLPSIPSVISGPVSGQCGQTGVSYFINPVSNATGYSWSSTCGTIVGPTNLSGISMDWASNMTSCIISVSSVNACGNSAPRTLLVTGAPNTPTSISGPLSVCANDVSQYCANGSNGATSFQWTVPAGATILGPANGVCILVQWGATGGTIIVRALNDCGMSGSKTQAVAVTCRNAQVSGVSIPSVEIFPNPTTGKVNIHYYASGATSLSIQALDLTGRIILSQNLITDPGINIHELDLSSLAKGVYMIHLNGKEINEMLKVTVE